MSDLQKIISFAIAISFMSKIALHLYLNNANNTNTRIGPPGFMPIEYFLKYTHPVKHRDLFLKKTCNVLLFISIIGIGVEIIIGFIK